MTDMDRHGVLYVATHHERYVREALASATSLKRFCPEVPVCLFTDLAESSLVRNDCFDMVLPVVSDTDCGTQWGRGLRTRMLSLPRSPFERTFHLDSDTRFLTDGVRGLFRVLDEYDLGIVEDSPEVSVSVRQFGRPLFNAGVMLYRKSDVILKLFAEWQRLFLVQLEAHAQDPLPPIQYLDGIRDEVTRRKMLANDQFALGQLLSPERNVFGIKVKVLDQAWNFSGTFVGRSLGRPVHVDHGPHLKTDAFSRSIHKSKPKSLNEMVTNLIEGIAKAKIQLDSGDVDSCQATLENAICSIPNQRLVQVPLASESIKAGLLDRARLHAERAIHADPSSHHAFIELATAHFNSGDLESAADCVRRCRSRFPLQLGVLGLGQIIDAQLGRAGESIARPDYGTLLWKTDLPLPADLRQALIDFVLHQQLLETEPPPGTPPNFFRSAALGRAAGPAVAAFKQHLRGKISQYITFLANTDHPLSRLQPAKLAISCWGTVCGPHGYMPAHVHENAWLSGVTYLSVPTDAGNEDSGKVEFGRPPVGEFRYTYEPRTHEVAPADGMLLTFPAYYWHGTLPHTSSEPRVSIGFNVLGADDTG